MAFCLHLLTANLNSRFSLTSHQIIPVQITLCLDSRSMPHHLLIFNGDDPGLLEPSRVLGWGHTIVVQILLLVNQSTCTIRYFSLFFLPFSLHSSQFFFFPFCSVLSCLEQKLLHYLQCNKLASSSPG